MFLDTQAFCKHIKWHTSIYEEYIFVDVTSQKFKEKWNLK